MYVFYLFNYLFIYLFVYFYRIWISHHMLLWRILRVWNQNIAQRLNCFVGLDIMVGGSLHHSLMGLTGHSGEACCSSSDCGLMHPVQFLFSVLKMTSGPYVEVHQRQRQLACMLYPLLMKLPVNANLGIAKRSISSFLFGFSFSDCTWENALIVDLTSSWSHILRYRRTHNIMDSF